MKVATVVGARPQFIKAAPVSRALREAGHQELLVHTGQHYDFEMSQVFFEELRIPQPDVNLEVGSGPHGWQTGRMLIGVEEILRTQQPDLVLVYGDTNSTLAGALAACKLRIPLAHVEAGLRSHNREMAEEHNRVLTDHVSDLLLCPTHTAVGNLKREGITRGVHLVGDVMYDSLLVGLKQIEGRYALMGRLGIKEKAYALATVHRAENTDNPEKLSSILRGLQEIVRNGLAVVVPLHPRTRQKLASLGLSLDGLSLTAPFTYVEMLLLELHARVILTDSGGVQKEAYWLGVPCVTLRQETEWVETVESGWNVLVGCETSRIARAAETARPGLVLQDAYGDGKAAERLVTLLVSMG